MVEEEEDELEERSQTSGEPPLPRSEATAVNPVREKTVGPLDPSSAAPRVVGLSASAGDPIPELISNEECGFFRHPGGWRFLEFQVIPTIVHRQEQDRPIRAWVVGCSTGEEAYALAILLFEQIEAAQNGGEFRIFATDTDPEALKVARAGLYPSQSLSGVSPEQLERFFVQEANGYRICTQLRAKVLFSNHTLLANPPYSHLDLVCCRHLKDGLAPALRSQVLGIFHGSLRREGYVFLGRQGMDGQESGLFEPVHEVWRIYRRIGFSTQELIGTSRATVVIDRQFLIRRFNLELSRLFNLTTADMPIDDFMRQTADPDLRRDVGAVISARRPIAREIRIPGGRWSIRRVLPVSPLGERLEEVIVTYEDITSLRLAERAAQEARHYAEAIVATIHEPLLVLDEQLQVKTANASYYRSFQTTPDETEGHSFHNLCIGWDGDSRLPGLLARVLSEEISLDDFEMDLNSQACGHRMLRLNARHIEGRPLILLAIEDISDRRRVERALRESEQWFRLVSENIPNHVWVVSVDNRAIYGNRHWLDYLGKSLDQLRDDTWREILYPEDQVPTWQAWEQARREGRNFKEKYRLRSADGNYRWFLGQAFPLCDSQGAIACWYGTNTDIEEVVRVEQALRENQERLNAALGAAEIGTWRVEIGSGKVTRDASCNRLLGLPSESSTQPIEDYLSRVHPEDRPTVEVMLDRAIRGMIIFDKEHRMIRPDGSVLWVRSRGKVSPGPDGQPLYMTGACVDITEQKQNQIALEQSQRRLQTLFDNVQEAILLADDQTRLIDVNPAACELTGYDREELLHRFVSDLVPEVDQEAVPGFWREFLETGRQAGESSLLRKDGTILTIDYRAVAQILPGLHLGVVHDITERKAAEARLREREERLRVIVETAADGIIIIDEHGIIESFNPAAEQIFAYTHPEVIGRELSLLMPPPYASRHHEYLLNYLRTGKSRMIGKGRELLGLRKDGSTFPLELSVSEFRDGDRRKFTGIVRDITERKRLEREVLEISAQEQRWIGQEMHDSTGQELTGLGFMAQSLVNRLEQDSSPWLATANQIVEGIGRVHEQLRRIAKGLIPVEVDPAGLMAALADLAARTSASSGVSCRFECSEPVSIRDDVTATHLYRITQEAVTNALRHGRASHIRIVLDRDGDLATLKVRDDGLGFSRPLDEVRGMGLRIMHYRAGLIGATLNVGPAEDGGTLVACTFSENADHAP